MSKSRARFKKETNVFCSTGEVAIGYENYLKTEHWKQTRHRIAKLNNNICQHCGAKIIRGFHIHHLTYKNIGKELDSDLSFLCKICHNNLHDGRKKSKRKENNNQAITTTDAYKKNWKNINTILKTADDIQFKKIIYCIDKIMKEINNG